jgi:hypothetical protein
MAAGAVDRREFRVVPKPAARRVHRRHLLLDGGAGRLQPSWVRGDDDGPGAQGGELTPSDSRHHEPPEVAWLDPLDELDELGVLDGDWSWLDELDPLLDDWPLLLEPVEVVFEPDEPVDEWPVWPA